MIENFPGNSHKVSRENPEDAPPEEKKNIEPVIRGEVIRRKKTLGRRIMDTFFGGDTNSVFGYLLRDVLVPALQATATDLVTQGIQKAVYGEARPTPRAGRPGLGNRTMVSYDRYHSPVRPPVTPTTPPNRRPTRPEAYQTNEIILERRIEAETVLERLYEIIQEYGIATVADLNSLVGQSSDYTDHKWGWDNLRGSKVSAVREGFLLVLPEPEDLR